MRLTFNVFILTSSFLLMLFLPDRMNATIEANDDWYTVFSSFTDNEFDVTQNDTVSSGCTNPVIQILDDPSYTGTATVSGSMIIYTPATGETADTLRYSIHCVDESETDTATVYITIAERPEYISDIDCWIDPVAQDWAIQKLDSVGLVRTVSQFLVGDMNDDGYPDIVATGIQGKPNINPDKIKTFYGPDFTTIDSITGITPEAHSFGAIGKIKVSEAPDVYENLIFYRDASTNLLYATNPGNTFSWTSDATTTKGMIGLADFNGDGWTEVFVGNKIFDAATGKLLADGGSTNNTGKAALMTTYSGYVAYPQAVNILGDDDLELVAGNQIYKVEIDRTAGSPKILNVISSVGAPSGAGTDGVTVVGDFNNDGKLEVLVRQRVNAATTGTTIHLYLWSPHTNTNTGTILAKATDSPTSPFSANSVFFGIPFVGDIDGDGRIEIVTLISNGRVEYQLGFMARKYNEVTGQFELFWDINHVDQSGGTGMTLFDFNLDGIAEIVYRDEYELRIINGSKKSHITGADTTVVYTLSSFKSYSATAFEYPVIADIYNNGSSAILVTSDTGDKRTHASQDFFTYEAYIDIFTSDPASPWAPARKVWNQYSYNPVRVNEDLTIPERPIGIATTLPGPDGILGTTDDVRPFNNIMQQQTMLNKNGTLLWLAPDIIPDPSLQTVSYAGNRVNFNVGIVNIGAATFTTPLNYTLYKNSINPANKISTYAENTPIQPGDTLFVTVKITDISTLVPFDKLIIRINDDGTTFPIHQECDITNNELVYYPLLYNQNSAYPASGGKLPSPNPVCLLNYEYTQVAGNSGNLQRPPADSLIFVGWSPTDGCIPIEFPEEEPEDILFPRDSVQIQNNPVNLYVVWAYDKNGNGIPDYWELQVRIIPVHQWSTDNNDPLMAPWYKKYEEADASYYAGCELDLVLTALPHKYNDRIIDMSYLGALVKDLTKDMDDNALPDMFILEKQQGEIRTRFVLDTIPDDVIGKTGAIAGKLEGGRSDTSSWGALYNHPSYDSLEIRPYYNSKYMLNLGISGGSPNLMRSINELDWRNVYLPLTEEERMATIDGVSIWVREPSGCWERRFYFSTYIDPTIQRYVRILSHPLVTTTPGKGVYYVEGHQDFSFTASFSTDNPLKVTAEGTYSGSTIDMTGILLDNGNYEYTLSQVVEPWTISFEQATDNEYTGGLSAWAYKNTLYIRSEAEIPVSIYTITGILYKQFNVPEGERKVSLPQGMYFVVFGNGKTQKVRIE
ncbi:MAG: VCBS repeat-containing protein [Tannerella sp.]|jgi:hypothetical protein|nr:VCBS repeat-containing protein [Tannerella sp.]